MICVIFEVGRMHLWSYLYRARSSMPDFIRPEIKFREQITTFYSNLDRSNSAIYWSEFRITNLSSKINFISCLFFIAHRVFLWAKLTDLLALLYRGSKFCLLSWSIYGERSSPASTEYVCMTFQQAQLRFRSPIFPLRLNLQPEDHDQLFLYGRPIDSGLLRLQKYRERLGLDPPPLPPPHLDPHNQQRVGYLVFEWSKPLSKSFWIMPCFPF